MDIERQTDRPRDRGTVGLIDRDRDRQRRNNTCVYLLWTLSSSSLQGFACYHVFIRFFQHLRILLGFSPQSPDIKDVMNSKPRYYRTALDLLSHRLHAVFIHVKQTESKLSLLWIKWNVCVPHLPRSIWKMQGSAVKKQRRFQKCQFMTVSICRNYLFSTIAKTFKT